MKRTILLIFIALMTAMGSQAQEADATKTARYNSRHTMDGYKAFYETGYFIGLNYKIPCSGVISRPAASTSCRPFFITSAGIHLRSTLTVRTRLRLRTMSIGA